MPMRHCALALLDRLNCQLISRWQGYPLEKIRLTILRSVLGRTLAACLNRSGLRKLQIQYVKKALWTSTRPIPDVM